MWTSKPPGRTVFPFLRDQKNSLHSWLNSGPPKHYWTWIGSHGQGTPGLFVGQWSLQTWRRRGACSIAARLFWLRTQFRNPEETKAGQGTETLLQKQKMLCRVKFGQWKRLNRKNETTFSALHWKRVWTKVLFCPTVNISTNRMQTQVFISAERYSLNVHREDPEHWQFRST